MDTQEPKDEERHEIALTLPSRTEVIILLETTGELGEERKRSREHLASLFLWFRA